MKIIGKNRWEAINWVQDALGPATPRNIAEDTFGLLLREGLVEDDIDEMVLLEALDQDELRQRARSTMVANDMGRMRGTRVRACMRRGGLSAANKGAHRPHARARIQQLVDDTMADGVTPSPAPAPSPPTDPSGPKKKKPR